MQEHLTGSGEQLMMQTGKVITLAGLVWAAIWSFAAMSEEPSGLAMSLNGTFYPARAWTG